MPNDIQTAFGTFDVMNYPNGGDVSVYLPEVETEKYNTVEQRMKVMSIGKCIYQIGSLTTSFVKKTQTAVVLSPLSGTSLDCLILNQRKSSTSNLTWSIVYQYEFSGDIYLYVKLDSTGSLVTEYSYQSNRDAGTEGIIGLFHLTFVAGVVTNVSNHANYFITIDSFHPAVFQDPHEYLLEQKAIQVSKLSLSPNKKPHYREYCGYFSLDVLDGDAVTVPVPVISGKLIETVYVELFCMGNGEMVTCDDTGSNNEFTFHGTAGNYVFYYLIKCEVWNVFYFTGVIDGDLSNPLNYSPNGIPSSEDIVIINSP